MSADLSISRIERKHFGVTAWRFYDDRRYFGADVGSFECKGTFALMSEFGGGGVEWFESRGTCCWDIDVR